MVRHKIGDFMIVNMISMMNSINMRHNALSSTFANNDALMSMVSRPMIEPLDFRGLSNAEKTLEMDNYRNQLMYKVATLQEEANRKALDKKIKSSFNIFA